MLNNSNDIPEAVIVNIVKSYHARLERTNTEEQDEKERDFQRECYMRTALEWMVSWLRAQQVPAATSAPKAGELTGPTYYVRHPDDTYSVADPQPILNP